MPVVNSRSGQVPVAHQPLPAILGQRWLAGKAATSAATIFANNVDAPLRRTSVGRVGKRQSRSRRIAASVDEVEASSIPTIRRLIPSGRHQLSPMARQVLMN